MCVFLKMQSPAAEMTQTSVKTMAADNTIARTVFELLMYLLICAIAPGIHPGFLHLSCVLETSLLAKSLKSFKYNAYFRIISHMRTFAPKPKLRFRLAVFITAQRESCYNLSAVTSAHRTDKFVMKVSQCDIFKVK